MCIINICAIFLVSLTLARLFQKSIIYTVPITFCGLMIVLQCLAYYNLLFAIDWIAVGACVAFAVEWIYNKRSFSSIKHYVICPDTMLLLCVYVLVILLHWDTSVTDYDDYNFWAVNVKSLFFRDGMEAMHRNVSFSFGDYPLGLQLIRWWFVHLAGKWEERMLFIGGGIFLYSFIVPVFSGIRSWIKVPLGFCAAFLIPYGAYIFPYRLSPDVCMGAVYALALVFCVRSIREKEDNWYYPIAVGLFCVALVMIKSVGILWAAFVWIFWLVLYLFNKRIRIRGIAEIAIVIIPGFAMWKLWQRICYLLERSTYLTLTLQEAKLELDQGHINRALAYWEAFVDVPFRRIFVAGGGTVSLLLYLVLAFAALWYFTHKLITITKERTLYNIVRIYTVVSTIVYIIIILYSVLTMFYAETQYEDRYWMLHALILRYGCPLIISLLAIVLDFFVQYLRLEEPDIKRGLLPYLMCTFLLGVHVPTAVESVTDQIKLQQEIRPMIAELKTSLSTFLDAREKLPDPMNSRVYLLNCEEEESRSVWLGFVAEYLSEGTAVLFERELIPDTLWRTIWNLHITHIYFASETKTSTMEYSNLVGGEEFLYNTMYRVEDADVDYVLLVPEKNASDVD